MIALPSKARRGQARKISGKVMRLLHMTPQQFNETALIALYDEIGSRCLRGYRTRRDARNAKQLAEWLRPGDSFTVTRQDSEEYPWYLKHSQRMVRSILARLKAQREEA